MLSDFAAANLIAVVGISWFAASIVYARRARNAALRMYLTLVSIVLGTFVLFGVCGYVALFIWPPIELAAARHGWIDDRRFDPELWRRGPIVEAGQRTRRAMIDHLLATHDGLVGETTDEITALLGEPVLEHPWRATAATAPQTSCAYALEEPPVGIFDLQGWLVLVVGQDGRVVTSDVRWLGDGD